MGRLRVRCGRAECGQGAQAEAQRRRHGGLGRRNRRQHLSPLCPQARRIVGLPANCRGFAYGLPLAWSRIVRELRFQSTKASTGIGRSLSRTAHTTPLEQRNMDIALQTPDGDDTPRKLVRAAQYVRMSTEHQQYSTENQADMTPRVRGQTRLRDCPHLCR